MRCRVSDRWVRVIVVLILCVAVATVVAAYLELHEFMTLQSRRNYLVLVHMALSQYQEQHGRLPALHSKEDDAGVVESWRMTIAPLLRSLRSQRSPGNAAVSEDWADVQRIFRGSDVGGCVMAVFHTHSVWSESNGQSAIDPAIDDDPVIAVFWPDANVEWGKPVDLVVHGERVAFWTPEGEGMAIVSMQDVFLLRLSGQIDFPGGSTSTAEMANLLVE
ncbi:MAG: hypothetical protein JNL58_26920 [Planctomyces sp.]|nr:hypothetical protein [Planctomyces sp.]